MSGFERGVGAVRVRKYPAFLMALNCFHVSGLPRGSSLAIDLYLTTWVAGHMEMSLPHEKCMRRATWEKYRTHGNAP